MSDHLLDVLTLRPHHFLLSNEEARTISVRNAKYYLETLPNIRVTAKTLHVIDFEVEQVWEQARVLLHQLSTIPSYDTQTTATLRSGSKQPSRQPILGQDICSTPDDTHYGSTKTTTTTNIDANNSSAKSLYDMTIGDISTGIRGQAGDNQMQENGGVRRSSSQATGEAHLISQLEDRFFSIEKFNRETERFERADESGQPIEGLHMDIDWNLDSGDELEEAPKFGEDIDDKPEERHGVMYDDFFREPSLSDYDQSYLEHQLPHKQIKDFESQAEDVMKNGDLEFLADDIARDLFDDEVSDSNGRAGFSEDYDDELLISQNGSSHAQRQVLLNNQIRELEQQNINRREWTLSGEARAQQRPFNSLLAEDLDFERTGKAVPIITSEITTNIEAMIKARILDSNFDDLPKKGFDVVNGTRRLGLVDLDDAKSKVGLADLYETEFSKREDVLNDRASGDVKLEVLKLEISELFSSTNQQLDALSSWQFTPKTPKLTLSVINDVRKIAMEETNLNSSGLSTANLAMMAPQEIYDPSIMADQIGGTVFRGGIPTNKLELQREQKAKERQRWKRQQRHPKSQKPPKASKEKQSILRDLQSAQVSVITKSGERATLRGDQQPREIVPSSSKIKL